MLKNVTFRRNTGSGIPEGTQVASVQAPEGSEAIVQLVAIAAVDTDSVARPVGNAPNSVPLSVSDAPLSGDGRTIVATAGTRVALAASTPAAWVQITALMTNTGLVVVGGASTVVAEAASRRGTPLARGDSVTMPVRDLADVGVDAEASGDGVSYVYGV